MGTAEIAQAVFRWLLRDSDHEVVALVTQPDKPVGRRQEIMPPPLKRAAAEHGLPVLQPPRVRDAAAVDAIMSFRPDLVVVMAYGQILPPPLLAGPPHGCMNLHASILPRHRGAAPIQAAILCGDEVSGITVMQMNEGMDTGDILHMERIALRRRETAASLHDRLAALAPKALAATLEALKAGTLQATPQDESLATYAPKLDRNSGRINWNLDSTSLDRHVRAMHPWPGAFAVLYRHGHPPRRLKVLSALPCRRMGGRPGEILRISARGLLVACGSGSLLLRMLQIEGGKPMPAEHFLRGHPIKPGQDHLE